MQTCPCDWAGPRDCVAGGGGTESQSLEPSGESREGGVYETGDEPPLIRGVLGPGGGTESQSLEPSGESREGGVYETGDEPPLIRGVLGPPPGNFSKFMYLRTHFKPF